jgi:hypothetical protein
MKAAAIAVALMLVASCSPYIYKTEINGFSAGVDELASAYSSGLKSTSSDRQEWQRWQWSSSRAKLALTEGCVPIASAGSDGGPPCTLHEVQKPPPAPSQIERQAALATPIIKALRKYADALAAVTNAEDQQTLEAAQVQFRNSIEGLAKQPNPPLAVSLGPVVDVFSAAATAALNLRRYEILRDCVKAANEPVTQLGRAVGETLDAIRTARANELRLMAVDLTLELGPAFSRAEYLSRLNLIEGKVNSLEALRQSDPRQAAQDMVRAHDELARALQSDSRQAQAVGTSVQTFVDKAKAVREAFVH